MGKGAHFLPKYAEEIKKYIGFLPFPGTLNLELDKKNKEIFEKEKTKQAPIIITPQILGSIQLFHIKIKKINHCSIIIPKKTTHPSNIIEIIADKNIKTELQNNNNKTVS